MTMPDVCVVGAGTIGVTVAYELARAGASVRLLEAGPQVSARCSYANAGLLVPAQSEPLTGGHNIKAGLGQMFAREGAFRISPGRALSPWMLSFLRHSTPERVARATAALRDLGGAGLAGHVEYARQGIPTGLHQRGMLNVYQTHDNLASGLASLGISPMRDVGEQWSAAAVGSEVPGLRRVAGGIYLADQAHVEGRTYALAVMHAAQDLGVDVCTGTPVRSLLRHGKRVVGVITDAGEVRAGTVVVAAGVASRSLVRETGLRPALAPGKGYVIDLERRDDDPVMPIGLKEDMLVLTPYDDKLRIAGMMELRADAGLDQRRVAAVRRAAVDRWPALESRPVLSTWTGQRPCSADGLPYVGVSRRVPGLALACGHGQQGLILSPSTARKIRDEIVHGRSPRDDDPFSPDR